MSKYESFFKILGRFKDVCIQYPEGWSIKKTKDFDQKFMDGKVQKFPRGMKIEELKIG